MLKETSRRSCGSLKLIVIGCLAMAAALLTLCGCRQGEPTVTETKAPYVLTERQIRILSDSGLPTVYEELTLFQKSAIASIEDILCYLEQRYDDHFTYIGYVANSPVEQEHLMAASEAYPDCGPVTVYREYKNGSFTYRDDYSTLLAKLLYEQALNDWIARFIPESEFIVFSDVSQADDELQPERILSQAWAASYILIAEDACTEEELNALVLRFGPWLQEQARGASAHVTYFYLAAPEYMAAADNDSYPDLLVKLREGVHCHCHVSMDGDLKIYCSGADSPTVEKKAADEAGLLTPEELIETAGLPKALYERDYLERFIAFYQITQQNAGTLNIEALLSSFEEIDNMADVRSIFSEKTTARVPSDPAAITVIAFFENINTDIESVYYDFQSLTYYHGVNCDLFFDLNQVPPRSMDPAEADSLREALVDLQVLNWVDTQSSEKIEDPQAMGIAIRFADGSLFRATASGLLYRVGPTNYRAVRDLLLER